jgi:hypothetical protein
MINSIFIGLSDRMEIQLSCWIANIGDFSMQIVFTAVEIQAFTFNRNDKK